MTMNLPEGLTVTMNDIRTAGYCGRLGKFFRTHGLADDLRALAKGGTMPADRLLATGDPRAEHVVRLVLDRTEETGVAGR